MRWTYDERSLALESGSEAREIDVFPYGPVPGFSDFPAVFFLDRDVFDKSGIKLPAVHLHLDPKVLTAFTMASTISARFFSWPHLWMPIISQARWKRLTGPSARPASDVKLLLFAMKLLLWVPSGDSLLRDPQHEDYSLMKDHLSHAENAGLLNLNLLQAWILTTIYEYAHGIYPASYISIGTCLRYALAMEIDKQRRFELDVAGEDLDTQEEKRRVWWSVIILDRMISRSSSGPEPRPDDLLPVNDVAWDEGHIDPSRIYPVSSPASTNMGMLARLSQAAFLLGRVYRWKNHPTGDAQFDYAEKIQLDRALRALINLTYEEGYMRLMPICPQTALTFSALVILHSQNVPLPLSSPSSQSATPTGEVLGRMSEQSDSESMAAMQTLQFLRPIAEESAISTKLFFRRQPWSIEKSSPLLLHWTYLIAVAFVRILHGLEKAQADDRYPDTFWDQQVVESMREAKDGIATMKTKLSLLGKQWIAADAYLRILEARESGDIG